jgi:SPP1 family predicted phage head-tail adaptor
LKCCDLSAGTLREPLTFQRRQTLADGMGGTAIDWVDLFHTKADVRPLTGREAMTGMQREASVSHRIFIRYREDILPSDRIIMRTKPMQIIAIINIEMRNRWLELQCLEGVAT